MVCGQCPPYGTDAFEGRLKNPVSRHRYLYGNANPITYLDPSGNNTIAEVATVLSIIEILTVTTAVQASIGQIARKISGDIIWEGSLSAGDLSATVFGIGVNGGLALLDLTTTTDEESPFLYPGIIDKFRGKWFQVYGGVETSLPEASGGLSPGGVSFKDDVTAFSPRAFKATPATFAGTVAFGSISSGIGSGTDFTAGFGRGFIYGVDGSSPTAFDSSISIKEGVSIPVWFFPVNNQPTLPPS
jgi:hypothetical protein